VRYDPERIKIAVRVSDFNSPEFDGFRKQAGVPS